MAVCDKSLSVCGATSRLLSCDKSQSSWWWSCWGGDLWHQVPMATLCSGRWEGSVWAPSAPAALQVPPAQDRQCTKAVPGLACPELLQSCVFCCPSLLSTLCRKHSSCFGFLQSFSVSSLWSSPINSRPSRLGCFPSYLSSTTSGGSDQTHNCLRSSDQHKIWSVLSHPVDYNSTEEEKFYT